MDQPLEGRHRRRLWHAIAERADVPGQDGWAQAVCVACVETLPRLDGAIVALRGDVRAQQVLGASDSWAAQLAETQYTVGEGPGVEAYVTGGPILIPDLGGEQERWPGFVRSAMAVDAAAMFAFPLQVGAIRLGTLELVRRRSGGLSTREVSEAVLLAELATIGLLEEAGEAERAGREFAPRPVTSFRDVNVATGMLAAQLRISLDDAFIRLRAHAFGQGRSVLAVARDVLDRRIRLEELAE
ncbi:GAF and ANTAR domain-containing protein [Actinomadura citrea]|uniref:GAF and ANTAR domain-containing protein n=1 Tax=Actinomadura citrea TaxID=46158 RepID=UPI002E2C1CE1|nr:GAF and ANTAR domain-containing protein [Actinomadura citrea]